VETLKKINSGEKFPVMPLFPETVLIKPIRVNVSLKGGKRINP
jgi:hypothetical protein